MKRRLLALWLANFWAGLAVLLVLKVALVGNNVFAVDGFAEGWRLFAKLPLFVGADVLGAALLATVVCVACLPLVWQVARPGPPLWVSTLFQALHGFLATLSFYTSLYIGGPLNKASLDLALLDQPATSGLGRGPSVWSSFAHYISVWTVGFWFAMLLLGAAGVWLVPRLLGRCRRGAAWTLAGLLAASVVLTCALLPRMVNGELLGIRIHTFGLEKSAWVELAWSYARPALASLRPHRASRTGDEFRLDMTSLDAPGPVPDNPLAAATPRRTNVILVSFDSVGLSYLVEEPALMPLVTSIGSRPGGVFLGNHYSVWPQTMKVFFAVLCSELPYPHYPSITAVNPAIPCRSLPEVLHDHGYWTGLITSANLAYDRKMRFFQHRQLDLAWDMRSMPGRDTVWSDSWGLDERLAVRNLLDLAAAHRDQGFFIFYEMTTAHHPYNACREHEENPLSDDFAAYRRALGFIDDRFRDLFAGLAERGLSDDTLVVLFSDHGEGFGQHPGNGGHGPKVYQETIQVPAVLVGPQLAGVSGRAGFVTSHVDLGPTILGLLGLPIPCTMKGRNVAQADVEARIAFFGGRPPDGQMGVADSHWKYILEESGYEMLFDLALDPGERVNVFEVHPDLASRYKAKVVEWQEFSENLIENYADVLSRSGCRP